MADDIIRFPPDSTDPNAKQVVFNRNSIPGVSGDVYYQYVRLAQPPTYIVVADNSSAAANKNHVALYNKTSRRLRVEHIYAHPHTANASGTHTMLQVGVITTEPTNGTDIEIRKFASDFANNPSAPNNVVAKNASTVSPIANYILGGGIIDTDNTADLKVTATLFKKDLDISSIQLLNGEGIVVRQTGVASSGTISTYVIFTLDTV
jgi:hypothetical protein